MNKIVLYCKSYHLDVHRAKDLLESITKHNIDNIPFYISVPSSDIELFKKELGESNYILLHIISFFSISLYLITYNHNM